MAATANIAVEVARLLVEGWDGRKLVEIGSYFTPSQIADEMGEALGRAVEAKAIPRDDGNVVLQHMGLESEQAANWSEMQDGFNSGWIDFGRPGAERVVGVTMPAQVFSKKT